MGKLTTAWSHRGWIPWSALRSDQLILLLDPPTALETRASGPSLNVQVTFLNYAHCHHWYRRRRPALRRPGTEAAVRGTL